MYCNQCGNQLPDGSRFCSFCGANLTAVQSVPQPAPVQSNPYFDIRHGVLVKYKGREQNVVVPAGVVEIEENAFTGYDMESITFPEGCLKIRINTFVKRINFPSRIESFSLACGGSKKMESITIPEGCLYVGISCYVKTIRLPATIESFFLFSNDTLKGSIDRRLSLGDPKSAQDIYFAPGTKAIKGHIGGFPRLHIPSSVTEIDEYMCIHVFETESNDWTHYYFHYYGDHLICDNIDMFSPEFRKTIYKYKGLCTKCGGEFMNTVVLGKFCRSCGKPKEYYSEWHKAPFGGIRDKKK